MAIELVQNAKAYAGEHMPFFVEKKTNQYGRAIAV